MDPTIPASNANYTTRVEFPDRPTSDSDRTDESVPLLPQWVDVRSKPSIFNDLHKFHISFRWCALDHSSCTGKIISYATFIILSIAVPIVSMLSVQIPHSVSGGIAFDKLAQLPETALATIAFFTLTCFFRKYSLRQLLLLDGLRDDSCYVRYGYARELNRMFRCLTIILLPSFAVEFAHKIMFFSVVTVTVRHVNARVPCNAIMFVAVLASWAYRTGIFLLVCMLFRLTCELQILRLEGLRQLLQGFGSDAGVIFKEHTRIKKQLSVTSHRFRIFIIGCFVTITISQLGALLLVLASKYQKNFFNSGDLVVCSAVQLSGFLMCLMGAARITHRAQGVVAIATRWHMLVTCTSNARSKGPDVKNVGPAPASDGFLVSNCGSDSELPDTLLVFPAQDASAFETRQALVTYLQHNGRGITLFGFALDRGLLHTLFAFEFSLLLWILSKVVVLQ